MCICWFIMYLNIIKKMWLGSRVFLEKMTGSQLVNKFPTVYWIRKYCTAFTTARHISLFWARSIQSMPPIARLEEPVWYYPPTNALVFQVDFFPQVSSPKPLCTSTFPHTCYMSRLSHMWLNIFINAHLLVYRIM